MYPR